jgi:hypothetical protein
MSKEGVREECESEIKTWLRNNTSGPRCSTTRPKKARSGITLWR